jgi:hypothetical protein
MTATVLQIACPIVLIALVVLHIYASRHIRPGYVNSRRHTMIRRVLLAGSLERWG